MTRHGKNCTAGSVYTYNERKKDSKASGYGSNNLRMGKDSIKEFDCCCLTLQPCRNPVVTPQGFLFEKEAILEYVIHQKRENVRKMKEYDKQVKLMKEKQVQEANSEHESKVKAFVQKESSIISTPINPFKASETATATATATGPGTSVEIVTSDEPNSSISNMKEAKKKVLPSFWLPSLTPQADKSTVRKPDGVVRCPMSGQPLKIKDLTTVNFTPIKDGDSKTSIHVKKARYVCPVSNDVISNSAPCVVLKPSGWVITEDCYEKLVKKDGVDPCNGAKLREKDVIWLQRGASGFSGSGLELKAKKEGASLMA